MVKIAHGDILKADAEALVNTVNCAGIMGRGIALQFKNAYPSNFEEYEHVCKKKQLHPGMMLVHRIGNFAGPKYIVNFPTKRHWKGKSKLEDIQKGLDALVREIHNLKIRSIAIPPLGCGLGGLDWSIVRPMIEKAVAQLSNVDVLIYEPKGAPEADEMVIRTEKPKMTPGRAAIVMLIDKYIEPMLDDCVTLLEVHKLMYFMQEAGERLRLQFAKGSYGPYAANLRHVLIAMEGHYTQGFGEGSEDPKKEITILPDASKEAARLIAQYPETKIRLAKVAELIEGFETPFGMELLATVLWTAKECHTSDEMTIKDAVWNWSERKRQIMKPEHIAKAVERLHNLSWI